MIDIHRDTIKVNNSYFVNGKTCLNYIHVSNQKLKAVEYFLKIRIKM